MGTPKNLEAAIYNALVSQGMNEAKSVVYCHHILAAVKDRLAQDFSVAMMKPPNEDCAEVLRKLWKRVKGDEL